MTGFWAIFFLMVVLKIPVLGSIWIVWWASRQYDEEPQTDDDGGNKRRKMPPKLPRDPRRGPHGGGAVAPLPACPPHPGRQAGCTARFRSRRIARRYG